jgi:hypothetical protein
MKIGTNRLQTVQKCYNMDTFGFAVATIIILAKYSWREVNEKA